MSSRERVPTEVLRGQAPRTRRRPPWGLMLGLALLLVLVAWLPEASALGYALRPLEPGVVAAAAGPTGAPPTSADAAELAELADEAAELEKEIAELTPRGSYIVIDRGNNRLWVRNDEGVVHEAVVSTGSGAILQEAGGQQRRWTFDTPGGRLRVLGKRANPVWVKPDWAFLEEGQAPPRQLSERMEKGTLGEWALDLGDGYMIHGTLYERLLGRSLTHGCIRVGRDDLRVVVGAARAGTPVFIF